MFGRAKKEAGAYFDRIVSNGLKVPGGIVWMKADENGNVVVLHRRENKNKCPNLQSGVILQDGSAVVGHPHEIVHILHGKTGKVIDRFKLGKVPDTGDYRSLSELDVNRISRKRSGEHFPQVVVFYWNKTAVNLMLQGT